MKITVLGSGTGVPRVERASPSHLVEFKHGEKLLLDVGPGALRQLAAAGVTTRQVGRILVSHFHPDHTLDLVHFLFASKYFDDGRTEPLHIAGPKGFRSFFGGICAPFKKWVESGDYPLGVEELGIGERAFPSWTLTVARTEHLDNSLAFRLQEVPRSAPPDTSTRRRKPPLGAPVPAAAPAEPEPSGPSGVFVYSGDAGYSGPLVDLARGADLLFLECSLPDDRPVAGHCTPSEAARVAREAEVKRLVLVHLYPPCDQVDVVAQVRAVWDGDVEVAQDLTGYEV